MALAVANTFWNGPSLGPIHSACLRSFLSNGHTVRLFAYTAPADVPPGVEVLPASEILPWSRVSWFVENGHIELASDLFRYHLLAASAGLWVDADCFSVNPIEDDDYIFGQETVSGLNSAVLKLPSASPVLRALCSIDRDFIPPWESRRRQRNAQWRRMLGRPRGLERWPWGTIGPTALTYYAKEFGILDLAEPSDVFYPVHWDHLDRLVDVGLHLSDLTTTRTKVVHLYTSLMRRRYRLGEPPVTSPLGHILSLSRPMELIAG